MVTPYPPPERAGAVPIQPTAFVEPIVWAQFDIGKSWLNIGHGNEPAISTTVRWPYDATSKPTPNSSAGKKMNDGPTREEIDAKIGKSQAETGAQIARMEGKMDTLSASITARFDALSHELDRSRDETRDSRLVVMATVIGSALAVSALIVGLATYGDALFGRGMDVRDLIRATIAEDRINAIHPPVLPRQPPAQPATPAKKTP